MRLWRRKRKPKVEEPKVWVTINGYPFYIPVTSDLMQLADRHR